MDGFQFRIGSGGGLSPTKAALALLGLALCLGGMALVGLPARAQAPAEAVTRPLNLLPGMAPVIDPSNLYSEARAGKFSPAVAGALERIYVPNVLSGDVSVIDPKTLLSTAAEKCARWRRKSVPVRLREKGCESPGLFSSAARIEPSVARLNMRGVDLLLGVFASLG